MFLLSEAGRVGRPIRGMADYRVKLALLGGVATAIGIGLWLLLRWMERRGWVRLRGTAGGAAAGGMDALREFVDPPAQHVHQVREQQKRPGESGDPPGTSG